MPAKVCLGEYKGKAEALAPRHESWQLAVGMTNRRDWIATSPSALIAYATL